MDSSQRFCSTDLEKIYLSNFTLAGQTISELQSSLTELPDILSEHEKSYSSKESLPLLNEVFWNKAISPSRFLVRLHDKLPGKSYIGAMIGPFYEFRDKLGQNNKSRFKNGYELPVSLLNSMISSQNAIRLEKAIGTVIDRINVLELNCDKRENAFCFLLFVHVLEDELSRAIHGLPSLIYQYSMETAQLTPQKFTELQAMKDQERCDLVFEADMPAYDIGQILDTWDSVGELLSQDWDWRMDDQIGFWDFKTFFPFFESTREMELNSSASQVLPMIRMPLDLADAAQRIVASNAFPFNDGIDLLSKLLDIKIDGIDRIDKSRCIFKKIDSLWLVQFDGVLNMYKDLLGFEFINALLRYPLTEFGAIELSILISEGVRNKVGVELGKLSNIQLEELGLSIGFLNEPYRLADKQYGQELKNRIAEIEEQITSEYLTDPEVSVTAESELKLLRKVDREISGFFGRHGMQNTTAENARTNVSHRIDLVLKEILKHNKSLELHFRRSLKRGYFLSYMPDSPNSWVL